MSGLKMKYFVLKPDGDDQYAEASRDAIIAYARCIDDYNSELAEDLYYWVDEINTSLDKKEDEIDDLEFDDELAENEEDCDYNNNVDIELEDHEFIVLSKIAHERDITFNQLCNDILREHLEKVDENEC